MGLVVLLGSLLALPFVACSGGDAEDLREVTFMAGFRAQANLPFVAVYVADAEGFFADEGLHVNIQHSSGQDEHLRLLLEGSAHFVTGTAAQAMRRAEEGLPMRAVALFGQRGDQGYVARADAQITGPADFAGRSVGFKAGVVPAELHALLATAGLTVDDVELVSVGFDPRVFIEGGVDVYPVFLNNEPDTIQRAGVAVSVIDPHDFGVPTLGLTYLAHADTIDDDPELVERFLRATMRAVHWIDEHRDEAIEVTLSYAEGADRDHQRYLLDTDMDAARRADGRFGLSEREQWESLAELLERWEILSTDVDPEIVYDQSILSQLYEAGAFEP